MKSLIDIMKEVALGVYNAQQNSGVFVGTMLGPRLLKVNEKLTVEAMPAAHLLKGEDTLKAGDKVLAARSDDQSYFVIDKVG